MTFRCPETAEIASQTIYRPASACMALEGPKTRVCHRAIGSFCRTSGSFLRAAVSDSSVPKTCRFCGSPASEYNLSHMLAPHFHSLQAEAILDAFDPKRSEPIRRDPAVVLVE